MKTIIFDAYGTLINISSLNEQLQHHFGTVGDQIGQVWRQKQLEYTWLRTLMHQYRPFSVVTEEALVYACRQHQAPLSPEVQHDLLTRYRTLEVYSEVPSVLAALARTYPLAILSNADTDLLLAAVHHNRVESSLSAVLSADTVKQFKPSPSVYQQAADHFSAPKEEMLFVSSNPWDIAGARSFGFPTAWLKHSQMLPENLGVNTTLTIKSLRELIDIQLPH